MLTGPVVGPCPAGPVSSPDDRGTRQGRGPRPRWGRIALVVAAALVLLLGGGGFAAYLYANHLDDQINRTDPFSQITGGRPANVAPGAMNVLMLGSDSRDPDFAAGKNAGVRLMVGYMKRYDPAVERMAEVLTDVKALRFATSTTAEYPLKWYVAQYPIIRGSDVDARTVSGLEADDEARVTAAIGIDDPVLRHAYRHSLLDSMIHDLNLMRGLLGEPKRLRLASVGQAAISVFLDFPQTAGAMHWVNLMDGVAQYKQEFSFFSPQQRASLVFPSPFLRNMPTELVLEGGSLEAPRAWRTAERVSYESAFKRELVEFYNCVTTDRAPRTTAEDAVRDVALCQAIIRQHLALVGLA